MADKVVKLGVVGLGRGRGIVTDVIGDANIELTAICDMNPERVESARKFFTEENPFLTNRLSCIIKKKFDRFEKGENRS